MHLAISCSSPFSLFIISTCTQIATGNGNYIIQRLPLVSQMIWKRNLALKITGRLNNQISNHVKSIEMLMSLILIDNQMTEQVIQHS